MIRRAFTMRLKPGGLPEYKRYHDEIWPELVAEIERQGVGQITIFEDDPVLFLYSEIADPDAWDRLWHTEIHDKWGQVMSQFMVFNDEGIVDSHPVREIFHLETGASDASA
jgi:L-rhamnose mutarotase